jgi:hypothetical protein
LKNESIAFFNLAFQPLVGGNRNHGRSAEVLRPLSAATSAYHFAFALPKPE